MSHKHITIGGTGVRTIDILVLHIHKGLTGGIDDDVRHTVLDSQWRGRCGHGALIGANNCNAAVINQFLKCGHTGLRVGSRVLNIQLDLSAIHGLDATVGVHIVCTQLNALKLHISIVGSGTRQGQQNANLDGVTSRLSRTRTTARRRIARGGSAAATIKTENHNSGQ